MKENKHALCTLNERQNDSIELIKLLTINSDLVSG